MNLEVVRAAEPDKEVVRRLMQLYQYDFSAIEGTDVDAHGVFAYRWLDHYWTEEGRHPFLLKVDGRWAGFALVNRHSIAAAGGACTIAEFFVMRRYRRRGIGSSAARQIFTMFPGSWEIRETAANETAQAFWRHVISEQTGGRYEEINGVAGAWDGPIQLFEVTS